MGHPRTVPNGATVKRSKWALAMLFLVDGVGFGTWAAHVPVFKQFLHLENGSLTFVLVSLVIGAIITMPIAGQLIRHYGSRRVVRVVAVVYVLMFALLAQSSNLLFLILFAGLYGAAKGALDVGINAQAVTVEKQYGAPIMSFFQGCWSAGGLLGAGAASLMLRHGGTARSDLSLTAGMLILCSLWAIPFLVSEMEGETAEKRRSSKFLWPDAALLRLAALAFFGLMAEGAIADWASVYRIPTSALLFRSQLPVMPRMPLPWLLQGFPVTGLLSVSPARISCMQAVCSSPSAWAVLFLSPPGGRLSAV
jgi:MFS family permease